MKALKTISKWIGGAALAGALFMAAPQKSEAQVAVGVHIGGGPVYRAPRPVYVAPRPVYVAPRPVYYGPYGRPYARPYYGRPYYGAGYYRPYGYRPYYGRPGVSFGIRIR